jgi:very-short-patch-repair endonuclease
VRVFFLKPMHPIRRQISQHVPRLLQDMTDVERLLWASLRNRQLGGFKFRRQATVDRFVVDFFCVEASLAVELDGGQHTPERDNPRTRTLEAQGLHVRRFWNNEVSDNLDSVLAHILAVALDRALPQKKTLTQPSPAKAGEG